MRCVVKPHSKRMESIHHYFVVSSWLNREDWLAGWLVRLLQVISSKLCVNFTYRFLITDSMVNENIALYLIWEYVTLYHFIEFIGFCGLYRFLSYKISLNYFQFDLCEKNPISIDWGESFPDLRIYLFSHFIILFLWFI